jgi:hypothetical protein
MKGLTVKYDMSKFHLQPAMHVGGCAAEAKRQDVVEVELVQSRQPAIWSRCMECGAGKMFEIDESELIEILQSRAEEEAEQAAEVAARNV